MCTTTARKPAAARFRMADTEYETAREQEPISFLDLVIAATPAPRTVAAAVAIAAAPPAPVAVVKPAPVAQAVAVAAPVARQSNGTPRRQKLATRQLAVGLYAFDHAGMAAVVKNTAEGWQLIINGTPGTRRYETKRHAVNAARIVMEAAAAKSTPAPVAVAAPAAPAAPVVTRPAPAPATAPAPARRVSWKSEAAPWRREQMTSKQARLLGHLAGKMTACGLTSTNPLASKAGLNRGEVSDLIDSLKSQLGGYARTPRTANQTAVQGCSIGPFTRGFCDVCGLVQDSSR